MKKEYENPKMTVVCFDAKDIITTSGGNELPDIDPEIF